MTRHRRNFPYCDLQHSTRLTSHRTLVIKRRWKQKKSDIKWPDQRKLSSHLFLHPPLNQSKFTIGEQRLLTLHYLFTKITTSQWRLANESLANELMNLLLPLRVAEMKYCLVPSKCDTCRAATNLCCDCYEFISYFLINWTVVKEIKCQEIKTLHLLHTSLKMC